LSETGGWGTSGSRSGRRAGHSAPDEGLKKGRAVTIAGMKNDKERRNAKNAASKAWRDANPGAQADASKAWRDANPGAQKESNRRWAEKNPDLARKLKNEANARWRARRKRERGG
jgi:hypothetical protein